MDATLPGARVGHAARPRPRSFAAVVSIGLAAASLPLGGALMLSSWQLGRLAQQVDHAVYGAIRSTEYARLRLEQLSALERLARQYVLHGNPERLAAYRELRDDFRSALHEQRDALYLSDGTSAATAFEDVERREEQAFTAIRDVAAPAAKRREAIEGLSSAVTEAREELARAYVNAAREADAVRAMGNRAQRTVFWVAVALVPSFAALAVGSVVLISRPIRQLVLAVHRVGEGAWDEPVGIRGPRDLQELGRTLDWLRTRLREVETEKRRFLQHVSHELKTPLAAIREGTELLTDGVAGTLSSAQGEIAGIIHANTVRLQGLIEALLAFSRLGEPARAGGASQPVRLDELVEESVQAHALQARHRGLRFHRDTHPTPMRGDRGKLRALVDNLVSNAVKYARPGGQVALTVRHDGSHATVDVEDDGSGVGAGDADHIFEPFYQAAHQPPGAVNGSGLGLSIARECAASHGGRIELVPDARGGGAHFRVVLPLTTAGASISGSEAG